MREFHSEKRLYSEAEYLEIENNAEQKHELWFGEMFLMAGAKTNHNRLVAQTVTAINRRLDESPCVATSSDQRVRIEGGHYVYPDVVVSCEDAEFSDDEMVLFNPRVLVEVLSASTGARDWGLKLDVYKRIPSLSDYLIVSQNRVYIEHFRRIEGVRWENIAYQQRDQIIRLGFENLEIPVAEIYRRVEVPKQMTLFDLGED